MTNWGFDENDNDGLGNDTELSGPKALRDAYAALKKQNEDLNSKLTSFLEDQEKKKVQSVFENLGVPGAASLYTGEADPEKAKAWVESMRGVFGGNQGGTPPVADNQPTQEQAPQTGAIPPSMQAQFERISQAGLEGTPQGNFEAAQSELGNASSVNDLIAAMQRAQRM